MSKTKPLNRRTSGVLDRVRAGAKERTTSAEPAAPRKHGGGGMGRLLTGESRGLESKLRESRAETAETKVELDALRARYTDSQPVRKIPTASICAGPFYNRHPSAFDPTRNTSFAALLEQIGATGGNLAPIFVRRIDNSPDHDYQLIYGERRWRSCEYHEFDVLAIIGEDVSDQDAAQLHHAENTARTDVSVVEKGKQVASWVATLPRGDSKKFARSLGITPQHLSNLKLIGGLPEAFLAVHPNFRSVTYADARKLATLHRDAPDVLRQRLDDLVKMSTTPSAASATRFLLSGSITVAQAKKPADTGLHLLVRSNTIAIPETMPKALRAKFDKGLAALAKQCGMGVSSDADGDA